MMTSMLDKLSASVMAAMEVLKKDYRGTSVMPSRRSLWTMVFSLSDIERIASTQICLCAFLYLMWQEICGTLQWNHPQGYPQGKVD